MLGSAVISSYNMAMVSAFSNPRHPFGLPSLPRRTFVTCPAPPSFHPTIQPDLHPANSLKPSFAPLFMSGEKFEKMPDDDDEVIAFMDVNGEKSIDCYVDSYATVDGVEYTIGSPCDYAVALCYFEGDDQLVPIELDDPLMDDIFPIAEGIIEDEFGEELVLLRTPQTLTLVGVSFKFDILIIYGA